jgi:hypothetical protein
MPVYDTDRSRSESRGRSRWTGKHPVNARMRLVIILADGSQHETSLSVPLKPYYG